MTLSDFYDKYQKTLIEDAGSVVSEEFKTFAQDFRQILRNVCKHNGWKLAGFQIGHYSVRAFFCEENKKFIYINFAPSRHIELDLDRKDALAGILIRRADSLSDFKGHTNHFTNVLNLDSDAVKLMRG